MPNKILIEEIKKLFGTDDPAKVRELKVKNAQTTDHRAASLEPKNIAMGKDEVKALCKKIGYVYQDGDENRIFQMTYTDETVDRYGDVIKAGGCDSKNYMFNPVVLPFHNSRTFPIGQTLKLTVDKAGGNVVGLALIVQNSVDPTGTSEIFYKMMKAGLIKAGSIGFMPKKWTFPDKKQAEELGMDPNYGVIFEEWELLEHSICSVPANPNALQNSLEKGIVSREELKTYLLACKSAPDVIKSIDTDWISQIEKALGVTETPPLPPISEAPNSPKRKNLESWYEDDENFVKEIKEISDFNEETLKEKEVQHEPLIKSLEGILKGSNKNTIHSFIFPKSVWTFDKAKEYFNPPAAAASSETEKFVATLLKKIEEMKSPEVVEKVGAVLSAANKKMVNDCIAECAKMSESCSACVNMLTDLLSAANKDDKKEVKPITQKTGEQSEEATGYHKTLADEIADLLKSK